MSFPKKSLEFVYLEFLTHPENFHDRIFLGTILVDKWSHTSRFPLGKLEECVGKAGNPEGNFFSYQLS